MFHSAGPDVRQAANHPVPLSELKGFDRIYLEQGRTSSVTIELGSQVFALVNAEGNRTIYSGSHNLLISLGQHLGAKNSLSTDIQLKYVV